MARRIIVVALSLTGFLAGTLLVLSLWFQVSLSLARPNDLRAAFVVTVVNGDLCYRKSEWVETVQDLVREIRRTRESFLAEGETGPPAPAVRATTRESVSLRRFELFGFEYHVRLQAIPYDSPLYDGIWPRQIEVIVPLWLPLVVLLAYPTTFVIRGPLRRHRRRKRGLCIHCGYSLKGLPEPRCPECGEAT